MSALRCLIVDDERLARNSLRNLFREMPHAEVVGEAARLAEAVKAVDRLSPDVLLLDVQMPDGGGFELLRRLKKPPNVIFVTAYDHYALRAFEVNAVDYLLKPVEPERLRRALERVRRQAVLEPSAAPRYATDDMVLLELGASGHFRAVRDILAVCSEGKYTNVTCCDGQDYLVRRSMKQWVACLPDRLFMRLGRGLLINRRQISSADFEGRSATLCLGDGALTLELGRSAASRLRKLVG
jgi:two-component system LytT family response regulator